MENLATSFGSLLRENLIVEANPDLKKNEVALILLRSVKYTKGI